MIQNTKYFYGHKLTAMDGEIGTVKDFYFDDESWVVRYLVADTGSWLSSRKVLLAPHVFGLWDRKKKTLQVNLTRKQIEDSPSIESDRPVSRQHEIEYYSHFGFSPYWVGGGMWGVSGFPVGAPLSREVFKAQLHKHDDDDDDIHLRSTKAVQGYAIQASDGEIGKVTSFRVDDRSWAIQQVAVEAGHWYAGKEILIPVASIDHISYEGSQISVSLTKANIQSTADHEIARVER